MNNSSKVDVCNFSWYYRCVLHKKLFLKTGCLQGPKKVWKVLKSIEKIRRKPFGHLQNLRGGRAAEFSLEYAFACANL